MGTMCSNYHWPFEITIFENVWFQTYVTIDINIYFLLQKYFRVKFYGVQVGAKFDASIGIPIGNSR